MFRYAGLGEDWSCLTPRGYYDGSIRLFIYLPITCCLCPPLKYFDVVNPCVYFSSARALRINDIREHDSRRGCLRRKQYACNIARLRETTLMIEKEERRERYLLLTLHDKWQDHVHQRERYLAHA